MSMYLMGSRKVWAGGALAIGLLQAWDSNALEAGVFAGALILCGLVLTPAAIALWTDRGPALIALIASAILLTWGRVIAPVEMNALHIALFVPALYVFFASRMTERVV
jgi:hypothetical protein